VGARTGSVLGAVAGSRWLSANSIKASSARERGRERGERRDVAWGVVDGNDVASVVEREGGDGEEKGGARRHTPLLSNERSR